MIRSAATAPLATPFTVADWGQALNPAAVADYYFTGYDSILSNLAMEKLLDEDFPRTDTEAETPTVLNLRAALTEMYPGSTLEISQKFNKMRVAITVPGGYRSTWPVTFPTPGHLPHEVK